jgi:hypothetical protein
VRRAGVFLVVARRPPPRRVFLAWSISNTIGTPSLPRARPLVSAPSSPPMARAVYERVPSAPIRALSPFALFEPKHQLQFHVIAARSDHKSSLAAQGPRRAVIRAHAAARPATRRPRATDPAPPAQPPRPPHTTSGGGWNFSMYPK